MTVREYLEVLNNCEISNNMNPGSIQFTGFIDVLPSVGDIECLGESKAEYAFNDDEMVTTKSFNTKFGNIPVSKKVSLSDSIELHSNGKSESEVIATTISALKEYSDSLKASPEFSTPVSISLVENSIRNFEGYTLGTEQDKKR